MNDDGNQHWLPGDGRRLGFPQLVAALQAKAIELGGRHPETMRLEVIGLDFRLPRPWRPVMCRPASVLPPEEMLGSICLLRHRKALSSVAAFRWPLV